MSDFIRVKIESMLADFEAALKTRYAPQLTKELVFNRLRVLKADGYAEDVAFAKSLKEFNFSK